MCRNTDKSNDKVFRHVLMYCTFSKSKWIFSLILRRIVDLRYYFMYETSFFQKIHVSDFFTLSYCNNRNHAVSLRKLLIIYFSGFSHFIEKFSILDARDYPKVLSFLILD